ncbi:CPBP family intramembrane metalloprotease [Erwiniaceae bacterium BAC15a-03b]|uniref:CPBP family intramembrane metalloprotease n=1 Tax=Winslowiella arboricola TaxID=2978220 RepID=A0A9J6PQ39_9GAMM|nr:CPBP family intramembrane glutamic endopeptidase [Winslowiella arboricola]MCU5771202.1 CPBP family intramembrane metalloprotease [Winslowiella arboricola]MCU5776167.1 CPBP family intramembrane metalloprotease [Winslowiella arboricola]
MNANTNRVTLTLFYGAMFVLYYLITLVISRFPNVAELRSSGLLVPVVCLFEFAVLFPLYRFYCTRRDDIPPGKLQLKTTLLFLGGLLLLMLLQIFLLQPEAWLEQQSQQSRSAVLILLFTAVVLGPVFEEILFRGFLLQGFLLWAPKSPLACVTLTSLLFAAMHTQYVHLQTLAMLTLFSMLLCYARLKSRGLKLPIFLHMFNNLLALLPALYATLLNG